MLVGSGLVGRVRRRWFLNAARPFLFDRGSCNLVADRFGFGGVFALEPFAVILMYHASLLKVTFFFVL